MRDLKAVSQVADVELAASAAMITCHEQAKVQDTEAIMMLQDKIDVEEGSASDSSSLLLASYLMYTSSKERARGLAERVLISSPDSAAAQNLLGWIILQQQQDEENDAGEDATDVDEALQHFEAVLENNPDDIEALMGKAKALELKKDLAGALEVVTEVHVRFAWFLPALIDKTRLLLCANDWEQMLEHAGRVLQADSHNVMAMAWTALYSIVRDGNIKAATKTLQDVYATISANEPRNAGLYVRVARPFARLAGADPALLTVTGMMAERAVQLRPDHAPYLVEAGYNRMFLEEFEAAEKRFNQAMEMSGRRMFLEEYEVAEKRFNQAMELDELSLDANCGALECSLLNGNIDESANAVMFLEEMFNSQASMSLGKRLPYHLSAPGPDVEPPALTYLKGLQAWKLDDTTQGYGLTETCAASFVASPWRMDHVGTVGPPLHHTLLRLEAVPEMGYDPMDDPPAGEICIKGPGVFSSYYKNEAMTKESVDDEGFFHTGDIGKLVADGSLQIVDRKKNIFKLSHGEYVAVEKLEDTYKHAAGVEQVWVYGSSQENFLVAVVVPTHAVCTKWASEKGVPDDVEALCKDPAFVQNMLESLQAAGKAGKVKGYEAFKAGGIHLEPHQFSVEEELVTATFKLRRPQLQKKYQKQIDAMYAVLNAPASK
ncbi:hypothetical protein FOA52_010855 [Chlamydomonas sp. UWO 241]|nr:hypothetical protein FOA52_010855 [Chlamydomonas sp. UWO 241]